MILLAGLGTGSAGLAGARPPDLAVAFIATSGLRWRQTLPQRPTKSRPGTRTQAAEKAVYADSTQRRLTRERRRPGGGGPRRNHVIPARAGIRDE